LHSISCMKFICPPLKLQRCCYSPELQPFLHLGQADFQLKYIGPTFHAYAIHLTEVFVLSLHRSLGRSPLWWHLVELNESLEGSLHHLLQRFNDFHSDDGVSRTQMYPDCLYDLLKPRMTYCTPGREYTQA
jgi:hypothetical protein